MRYSYRNNVVENRVLPFVCIAHDCTQCVQNWIHNLCYIKTYVCEHKISSSKRADNIRPYEFVTFTKFVLTYHLYNYLRAPNERPYTVLHITKLFDIIFAYTQTSEKMIALNDKTYQNSIVCEIYLCYN